MYCMGGWDGNTGNGFYRNSNFHAAFCDAIDDHTCLDIFYGDITGRCFDHGTLRETDWTSKFNSIGCLTWGKTAVTKCRYWTCTRHRRRTILETGISFIELSLCTTLRNRCDGGYEGTICGRPRRRAGDVRVGDVIGPRDSTVYRFPRSLNRIRRCRAAEPLVEIPGRCGISVVCLHPVIDGAGLCRPGERLGIGFGAERIDRIDGR